MPLKETDQFGLAQKFEVKIDDGAKDLGSWTKVEGLDVTWDVANDQTSIRLIAAGQYQAGSLGGNQCLSTGSLSRIEDANLIIADLLCGQAGV